MVRTCFVLLLLMLGGLCGCGSAQPKLKVTSADTVGDEIERVAYEIGPPESFEFRAAAKGLVAHAIAQVPIEKADEAAIAILHGKTPQEIVAEWNKLTPEEQAAAERIVYPKKPEIPPLSPEEDKLMQATIKLAVSSRGKDLQVGIAIKNAQRVQREKELPDLWLAEQYEKGADHMIKEFGANSPNAEK